MTTSRRYTIITPRADFTGPVSVAVEIGRAAQRAGWEVSLLYLSDELRRHDLDGFKEVRRFRWRDLFTLDGVVHTHCLRPDLLGALLRRTASPHRLLTTLHNHFLLDLSFDHARWKVLLAWALWSRALRSFDARACVSATMQRYYRRKLPSLSFEVAYNFRSPSSPSPLPAEVAEWIDRQRREARIVLAYVGALIPRKNLMQLFRAIGAEPDLALLACGDGPQAADLKARAQQSDLAGRLLMAGQLADPRAALMLCDMLVLPSHAEGLPLAVLEAAQVGRPSLMSNIAVHRELAASGLGTTFDRFGFTDFRTQVNRLRWACNSEAISAAWQARFSPDVGLVRYAQLFNVTSEGFPEKVRADNE